MLAAMTLALAGYAPVNGLQLYYETHGKENGVPLVLLHGGGSRPPTLLIAGDRDIVRVEHAVQMQNLMVDARLAVLPATDHLAMTDRAADVAPMVDEFLRRGVNAGAGSRR